MINIRITIRLQIPSIIISQLSYRRYFLTLRACMSPDIYPEPGSSLDVLIITYSQYPRKQHQLEASVPQELFILETILYTHGIYYSEYS